MNETNLPRWNLDTIFSSINSNEYKSALSEFQIGMEKLNSLLKTCSHFNFSFWLKGFLEEYSRVISLHKTLNAYSYIIYSVDTTNAELLNNITLLENFSLNLQKIENEFSAVLSKNSKKLDDFFKRFPSFSEAKFIIEEKISSSKHKMTQKEELLAGLLQQTGGNAWGRLQEQLISNLKTPEGKTFNELRNDAYSPDFNLRKTSYFQELKLLEENKIAFAASLNNLKGETVLLNSKRKWKTSLDKSLFSNRLNKKTLQAMLKTIEKNFAEFRKYFLAKAKYLRSNNMTASSTLDSKGNLEKGLAFYDLFAPLSKNKTENQNDSNDSLLSKKWTFEEAKAYIIKNYASFSEEMAAFAKKVFDENWIDSQIRSGKVGGAYDEDFPLGHQSRILINFTGAFSDIITLAHEIGHAYHFSCLDGKSPLFFDYPMTLAETASTFAETIVKQNLLSSCTEDEKIQLLDMDLQDVSQVLVDILCRYYFEKKVFEEREKGELTADDFCSFMKTSQEKSYGRGLNSEKHEYMWAVKSHYYSTDLDFYNYPYAFGQLFAASLYASFKAEGKSFSQKYKQILINTGSKTCEDLCLEAGFDISKPDFWQKGIDMYLSEISEFILLTKKKSQSSKKKTSPQKPLPQKKCGLLQRAELLKKSK